MTITRAVTDGIATLSMDDGKANAFDLDFFDELQARFDECADDAAIVLAGREGMFSAGLNTKVLAAADDAALLELLVAFGRAMLRVWLERRPVVAAVTGHAVAGGTILALACDHAVAADGDYRWGLTETTLGFPLPHWIITLARGNVRTDRLDDLLLPGVLVPADVAVDVGFADVLAPPDRVVEVATARARELTALPRATYAETKRRLRGPAAEHALAGAEDDIRQLLAARGAA
jgi:enoyl-CoA hydratase